MQMPESRVEALEKALRNPDKLDLITLERSLNRELTEAWELFNVMRNSMTPEAVAERKKELYQWELFLLTLCKCNRGNI